MCFQTFDSFAHFKTAMLTRKQGRHHNQQPFGTGDNNRFSSLTESDDSAVNTQRAKSAESSSTASSASDSMRSEVGIMYDHPDESYSCSSASWTSVTCSTCASDEYIVDDERTAEELAQQRKRDRQTVHAVICWRLDVEMTIREAVEAARRFRRKRAASERGEGVMLIDCARRRFEKMRRAQERGEAWWAGTLASEGPAQEQEPGEVYWHEDDQPRERFDVRRRRAERGEAW